MLIINPLHVVPVPTHMKKRFSLGPLSIPYLNIYHVFTALQPKTLKFFVEKVREAFAMQKLLTFFQQNILANLGYLKF